MLDTLHLSTGNGDAEDIEPWLIAFEAGVRKQKLLRAHHKPLLLRSVYCKLCRTVIFAARFYFSKYKILSIAGNYVYFLMAAVYSVKISFHHKAALLHKIFCSGLFSKPACCLFIHL